MKVKPKLGGNPRFTVCYFHNDGGCTKPTCKYQHPVPPLDDNGELIVCREDRLGKICQEDCVFRHPSKEAIREINQPRDLRDVLTPRPPPLMSVNVTQFKQNSNKFSSKSEPTPGSSKKFKSFQKRNPKMSPTSSNSAVKRKSSSIGEASQGPRIKLAKSQTETEPRFEENGYYKVNVRGDNCGDLNVCDQTLVKFKQIITGCQGSSQVTVENELDETVVIPSSYLDRQIDLKACPRSCPFTHCKDSFSSEKPYMEHIILTHFYDKFTNLLKSSYSEDISRYRCPQQNCSESFSDIKDMCLHYGGFPHAKVIGLLFNTTDISVSQKEKEDKSKISVLKKKITEKEEELARLKSSHMNHLTVKDEEIEDQKRKVENLTLQLQEKEDKLKSQDAKLKDQERRLKETGAKVKGQETKLNELVVKLNLQATKLKNQDTKIKDQDLKLKEGETMMTEKLKEKETQDVQLREKMKECFDVQEEKL